MPPFGRHWLLCLASLRAIFAPVPSVSLPGTLPSFVLFVHSSFSLPASVSPGGRTHWKPAVGAISLPQWPGCLLWRKWMRIYIYICTASCINLSSHPYVGMYSLFLAAWMQTSLLCLMWCRITASAGPDVELPVDFYLRFVKTRIDRRVQGGRHAGRRADRGKCFLWDWGNLFLRDVKLWSPMRKSQFKSIRTGQYTGHLQTGAAVCCSLTCSHGDRGFKGLMTSQGGTRVHSSNKGAT